MAPTLVIDTRFEATPAQADSTVDRATELESGEISPEVAGQWIEKSVGYQQSGDQVAALKAREQAVEIFRLLHAKQPEIFELDLARELLELSRNLAGNGLIDKALEVSQESGKLYKRFLGCPSQTDDDLSLASPELKVPSLFGFARSVLGFPSWLIRRIVLNSLKRASK